jgi:hypothetical protein
MSCLSSVGRFSAVPHWPVLGVPRSKRYTAFAARDKNKNQIVTAVGRELLGFIWAIAVHTEQQQTFAATK